MTLAENYPENVKLTMDALANRQIPSFYAPTKEDALKVVMGMIDYSSTIGWGGSQTLYDTGIINALRNGNYKIFDRDEKDISKEEKTARMKKCLTADVFLASSSALTMDGKIVNKDGRGNRLSAVTWGPEKVILVIGKNKIVKDLDAAVKRLENIAAPLDAKHLNKKTPCVNTGKCMDCRSPDRICCYTHIIEYQINKDRINVIIVGEDFGF